MIDSHNIDSILDVVEAIQQLKNNLIVVKYGGAAMKNQHLTINVIQDIVLLSHLGLKIVLVHGGGPVINTWLQKMDINPVFHNGIRFTDKPTMEIVEMVLSGKVNKNLVSLFNVHKGKAVGLSGKDGNFIKVKPRDPLSTSLVGEIESIDSNFIHLLINNNYIPVIAPIACDEEGQSYNINADIVASKIAIALKASKLIFLTNMPGILEDVNNPNSLLQALTIEKITTLINNKVIHGGMIPKVDCCINASVNGVSSVHIIDGRVPHCLIVDLLTKYTIGSVLADVSCIEK